MLDTLSSNRRWASPDAFWERVERGDDCWRWTGAKRRNGYGRLRVHGKDEYAHRIAYRLAFGSIPDGLQIDHLCRNKWCVRPAHLEAVTPRENTLRAIPWRGSTPVVPERVKPEVKTHCKQGHPFTPENTAYRADRPRQRVCRTCRQATEARYRKRIDSQINRLVLS